MTGERTYLKWKWNEFESFISIIKMKRKPSHACLIVYEINKHKFERLILKNNLKSNLFKIVMIKYWVHDCKRWKMMMLPWIFILTSMFAHQILTFCLPQINFHAHLLTFLATDVLNFFTFRLIFKYHPSEMTRL